MTDQTRPVRRPREPDAPPRPEPGTHTDTAQLTDADKRAVHRVLTGMPYLPAALDYTTRPDDVAELVRVLAKLSDVLRAYGQQHTELESAHRRLRADLAAFRRILGVTSAADGLLVRACGSGIDHPEHIYVTADPDPDGDPLPVRCPGRD